MRRKRDYSKIKTYYIENLWIVIPMCITALLFNGLMCFLPVLEGKTIDSLKLNDYDTVLHYCIMFSCLVLFVQINRFFKRYLVRVFGNKMTLRMREESLNHLFSKDLSYFDANATGDILNRNLSDIADTAEGVRKMTTEVFDTIVLLIGYLTMMIITNYKLALLSIPFFVLSILTSHYMKKYVYKKNKGYKEYLSKNKDITLTRLNNELYYRGFGCSQDYFKEYEDSLETLKKKATRAFLFQSSLEPIYLCIAMLGLGVITLVGGMTILDNPDGAFTIGALSAFITTYALVARKAGKVGKLFNAYQAFRVSWVRVRDYLVPLEENKVEIELSNDKLTLKDFSYSYKEGFSLPSVTLDAHIGQIIGVCGRVHTGKTTLLRALSSLYSYSGMAILGNIPLSEFARCDTQFISYCSSDVYLFSDSIEENIRLGREGDLEKSLYTSSLDEDIFHIGGISKEITHTNANISGGEQKRLQMARALYPDLKLILLDDPFQSVSPDMARRMLDSLKDYKNSIIVFVSNNKEILEEADQIIYFDEHEAKADTYFNLYSHCEGFKGLMEA